MEYDLHLLVLALGVGGVAALSLASTDLLLYAGTLCFLLVVSLVFLPGDRRHLWFSTLCLGELVVVAVASAGRWEALVVQLLVLGILLHLAGSSRTVREYVGFVTFGVLALVFVLYADLLFRTVPILLQLGVGCMILVGMAGLYESLLKWRWRREGA